MKKCKKWTFIDFVIIAAVIAVIANFFVVPQSGTGCEKPIQEFCEALSAGNEAKAASLFPKQYEQVDGPATTVNDPSEAIATTCTINSKQKIEKSSYIYYIPSEYTSCLSTSNISSMYLVSTTFYVQDIYGNSQTMTSEVVVGRINGEWKIIDMLGV